ncbi:hypothetical protein GCM10028808_75060 [Spirosoma migulaei]
MIADQKKVVLCILWLLGCLGASISNGQQNTCCSDANCKTVAQAFVNQLQTILAGVGDKPSDEASAQAVLQTLGKPKVDAVVKILNDVDLWSKSDNDKLLCFAQLQPDRVRAWATYIRQVNNDGKFRSAEFKKGGSLLVGIAQGGTNIFSNSDTYAASGRLLYGYTFGIPSKPAGGHVRLQGGLSLWYGSHQSYWLGTIRSEIRLHDLSSKQFSFGTTRLVLEVNANKSTFIGGGGIGVEFGPIGLEILSEWQPSASQVITQFGCSWNFRKH